MHRKRLKREAYWILGGAIACIGAVVARFVGDHVSETYKVAVWLVGGAVIFIGLAVLSLGSHARRGDDDDENGAGDGNISNQPTR